MLRSFLFAAALQFAVVPPTPQTLWVLGWDDTTSVAGNAFGEYPDFVRMTVLPLLRPADTLVRVRLARTKADDRTSPEPETMVLDSRSSGFTAQVVKLYQELALERQIKGAHTTDIGRALHHLRTSIDLDRKANKPPGSYVLVIVSDGEAEGPQTASTARLTPIDDVNYRIVFLGINERRVDERRLREMASREGFEAADRALIVPITHVRQMGPRIASFLGRPVNATLVRQLARPASQRPVK